jgi:hypothetical protein
VKRGAAALLVSCSSARPAASDCISGQHRGDRGHRACAQHARATGCLCCAGPFVRTECSPEHAQLCEHMCAHVQGPLHLRTSCPQPATRNTRPSCSPHHCRCRPLSFCACASLLLALLLLLRHPSLPWPCQLRGPDCCLATASRAWRGWQQLSSQGTGQPAVLVALPGEEAPVMPSHPACTSAGTRIRSCAGMPAGVLRSLHASLQRPWLGLSALAQTNLFWLLRGPSSCSCS